MWSFVLGHSLLAMLVCGVVSAAAWYFIMRRRLNVDALGAVLIAVLCSVWGVFWLKMFSVFEATVASAVNGVLYAPANMSLFGAVFVDTILTFAIAKIKGIDPRKAHDIFCIGYMLPILFGRMNCFFAGCCVSGSFDYPIVGTIVWPIREIEVFYYLAFMTLFAPRIIRNETNGEVYPLFMISYGILRFVLEWTRETFYPIGPFHLSHVWAIISILVGMLLYMRVQSIGASAAVGRAGKDGGATR